MCNGMRATEDSPPGFLAVDTTLCLAATVAGEAQ